MSTQFFLEVALRASQLLNAVAPDSYQARELQADTFESQGKWEEAIAIYRQILTEHPKLRGIHYRLGHAFLALRDSPTSLADARKAFQQEIAIDPVNPASQYWLGEISRREAQWDEAISYFQAAINTDQQFAEAYLGLGTTYNSAGRYERAIAPLERYVKMLPDNPAGHYQLSISYARTGRSDDAERQRVVLRELTAKAQAKAVSEAPASPQ
jgi:tetratricopeptide (TPR) repeat protein